MDGADRLCCPSEENLLRFMRDELARSEVTSIVRHLLTGCFQCLRTTRQLWHEPSRSCVKRCWPWKLITLAADQKDPEQVSTEEEAT